jgi:hybrid polyketide synthase/nonribosomal peptide synthetase ACE1
MPSIKGVVQGAMILHDAVFPEMDLERLEAVTRPKVQGSIYLDEIFSHNTLDFLVFISSTAYAVGHAGQSAYAMANGFMAALATNRRHRGLAASVVNVGAIRGNGYISREMSEELQKALKRAGFSFLSEQMFHETFAEGILSSRPGRFGGYEITTGLSLEDSNSVTKSWRTNPIFSHLVGKHHNAVSTKIQPKSAISIAVQLKHATSEQQRFEIITSTLSGRICNREDIR